jgi:hypothetical protein
MTSMQHDRTEVGRIAEAWGANFGILGALLLALALPESRWGWVLFLCSNAAWLVFSIALGYKKLLLQTAIFTLSSLIGIANTFYPGNAFQAALQHTVHAPALPL